MFDKQTEEVKALNCGEENASETTDQPPLLTCAHFPPIVSQIFEALGRQFPVHPLLLTNSLFQIPTDTTVRFFKRGPHVA